MDVRTGIYVYSIFDNVDDENDWVSRIAQS